MSSIDANTSAIDGLIQLYKYEPFSNSFSLNANKVEGSSLSFARSSVELFQFLTSPTLVDVCFSSANGPNTSYSYSLGLVVDEVSGTTIYNSVSNTVTISPGRFVSPPSGTSYVFYKNEPLSVTFPSGLSFQGSIRINTPVTVPSLPIGVSWQATGDLTTYNLVGTPTLQSVSSNYNIIGTDVCGGRTITTRANFAVNAERMLVDLSGSLAVSDLSLGTPIDMREVSIRIPPYTATGGKIRYTWSPSLPPGFSFQTADGLPFSNGGITTDASSAIRLVGTPTSNTIQFFSNSSYTLTLTPTRTTSPFLTSNIPFTFSANQVILFTSSNVDPTFYTNAPIVANASRNSFKAQTQFATSPIVNIFSPNLRTDLSLAFSYALQRADLSGTPTSSGTQTFTVRAINANGKTADISSSLVVTNDAVQFTLVPTDVCATYITGRAISNAKTGYYSANTTFEARALSGQTISMTANSLFSTGLSFTSLGNNRYAITGTPINAVPLQTLTVTATANATGATANASMLYSIIADQYTFADLSSSLFNFVQNFPITPIQFSATTLSELPVLYYFSTTIPNGLAFSSSGRLSGTFVGTETSGSIIVYASTGYTTGSNVYPYTVRPDSMILFSSSNGYTVQAGATLPDVLITGITYSGLSVSNYQFSNLNPDYGLVLNSNTGLLNGVLTDSVPPNDVLPPSSNFAITGSAKGLIGSLVVNMTTSNAFVTRSYVVRNKALSGGANAFTILASDNSLLQWQSNAVTITSNGSAFTDTSGYQVSELVRANIGFDSNITLGTTITPNNTDAPTKLLRSTSNGAVFSIVNVDASITNISSLANKTGTSTWWGIGADKQKTYAVFVRSDDAGLTWSNMSPVQRSENQSVFCRDGWRGAGHTTTTANYYTTAGSVLRYKDGVLLAGGSGYSNTDGFALLRSLDEGSTWFSVNGSVGSAYEIATINVDESTRWIAAGSLRYLTDDSESTFASTGYLTTRTLFYTDDQGANWNVSSNDFNLSAYDVAYANNTWFASGVSGDSETGLIYPRLKYSTDGQAWTDVDEINATFPGTVDKIVPPIGIGPMMFDGVNWNVLTCKKEGPNYITTLYVHGPTDDYTYGWTSNSAGIGLPPVIPDQPPYTGFLPPNLTRIGTPTTTTFAFTSSTGTGPTITYPQNTPFVFYQYVQIPPIVFSATGTGQIYFFLDTTTLPLGLAWNPLTQTLSGAPVRPGPVNFIVYAKDDNGITTISVQTNTVVPRVVRKQEGAGAYTSLVRQYTIVNAAQNARDSRVFPSQERTLGEFMSPYPPDVVTASNCDTCK